MIVIERRSGGLISGHSLSHSLLSVTPTPHTERLRPMPGESDCPPLPVEGNAPLPTAGRLLGIDYGQKRLGIAVSNDEQTIASPLENYSRRSDKLDGARLQQLAREYRVVGCVVGLPLHMGGGASESSHRAQKFAAWIQQLTGLPMDYQDERCTSAVVEEQLILMDVTRQKRKQLLDKLAAQIILQTYIDRRRVPPTPPDSMDDAP